MASEKKGKQFRKRKAAESDDDEEELDVRYSSDTSSFLGSFGGGEPQKVELQHISD